MEVRALFSSRYAGSVGYYAAMLRAGGRVAIDLCERYDRRHHTLNRMEIVAVNGPQCLTAAIAKPNRDMTVSDICLSDHGNWRHNHWATLFSAYGRTPFFDYFADDLHAVLFDEGISTIAHLNKALHEAVTAFLDLPLQTDYIDAESTAEVTEMLDMRDGRITEADIAPYYQIWSSRYGFIERRSILDLLFNTGREAIFTLMMK